MLREHLGIRNTQTPPAASTTPVGAASTPVTSAPAAGTTSTPSGTATVGDPNSSISQVNPEFLAALPPHIQEEVGFGFLQMSSLH